MWEKWTPEVKIKKDGQNLLFKHLTLEKKYKELKKE